MDTLNWNQMSQLGLIAKINRDILHPLGLAMCRNPETGTSDSILIASDGVWEYGEGHGIVLSDDELKSRLQTMVEQQSTKNCTIQK